MDAVNASISENSTFVGSEEGDSCEYWKPPYTNERFWLVAVCGTTISIVSIFENVLLFFVFFTRAQYRQTYYMYLMLISVFDIFISASYVLLMSVNVLMDYYDSVFLFRAWFFYMVPMITISHIAMTASSFLILAATFERYCITLTTVCLPVVQKRRRFIAAFAILLGVFSKWTFAIEYEITHIEECNGTMSENSLDFSKLAKNPTYNYYWRFLYRNIVTVFVPFFMLSFFNVQIVLVLRQYTAAVREEINTAQRKASVRAATRMLVMVVCTYLIANVLNVVITFMEFFNLESLKNNLAGFYTFSVDIVSLLTVIASAVRLPIYCMCQAELRERILGVLFHGDCCAPSSPVHQAKLSQNNYHCPPSVRASLISNGIDTHSPLTVRVSLQDGDMIKGDTESIQYQVPKLNGVKKKSEYVDSGIDDVIVRPSEEMDGVETMKHTTSFLLPQSPSSSGSFFSVATTNSVPMNLYETAL